MSEEADAQIWDTPGQIDLGGFDTPQEAMLHRVEEIIRGGYDKPAYLPATMRFVRYEPMSVAFKDVYSRVADAVEWAWNDMDSEWGYEFAPQEFRCLPDDVKAKIHNACGEVARVVCENYEVRRHQEVEGSDVELDCREWLAEHRPDWEEGRDYSIASYGF